MRNLKFQLVAAGIIGLFGASVAVACGINFPWQLLDDRAATLNTMPVNDSFASEAARLAPAPKDTLTAAEVGYSWNEPHAEVLARVLTQVESEGLSSDQVRTVQQMRAENTGDEAFSKGALLPASIRLYTAGAVDFHKNATAKAIARFQAVLRLPASDRDARATWAAYMLGRLYGRRGDLEQASKSFALTRTLAIKGAPDPLGLAVASYGEEAKLHLARANSYLKENKLSSKQSRKYGGDIAAAVTLYAEQAAQGSTSAVQSLEIVAAGVFDDDAKVSASIYDPIVQQMLIAFTIDGGVSSATLSRLVSERQKRGLDPLADADKLAALAYRSGDYRLAEQLSKQAKGPLARWVEARLAMQKGNLAEAAKFYAEAAKAFPSSGDVSGSPDYETETLLAGESGVVTLARGEYVDAMEQLYPYSENYWGDVAYIAERVLTVDELKTFVDSHADTSMKSGGPLKTWGNAAEPDVSWRFSHVQGPAAQLRELLGRRLVRTGRYQEALKYFTSPAEEQQSAAQLPPEMVPGTRGPFSPIPEVQPQAGPGPVSVFPKREKSRLGIGGGRPIGGGQPLVAIPRAVMAPPFPQRELSRNLGIVGGRSIVGPGCTIVPYSPQPEQSRLGISSGRPISRGDPGCIMALDTRAQATPQQVVRRHRVRKNISEDTKKVVTDYVQALHDANTGRTNVDRARGWYRAAALAGDIKLGNEIMGYEGPPDYWSDGVGRAELGADDHLVTEGERQRFKASEAKPNFRYHYRFIAVDEATHAADLLPPRSQAFAAVLCHATEGMIRYSGESCSTSATQLRALPTYTLVSGHWPNSDDGRDSAGELGCQLYQRYLKNGPIVHWAKPFGRRCPEPNFVSAASFTQAQASREARRRHLMLRHRWVVVMQLAMIAVVLGVSTVWFLRHRYSAF